MTNNIFREWNAILVMLQTALMAAGWMAASLAAAMTCWGIWRLAKRIAFRAAARPYANYMKGGSHG